MRVQALVRRGLAYTSTSALDGVSVCLVDAPGCTAFSVNGYERLLCNAAGESLHDLFLHGCFLEPCARSAVDGTEWGCENMFVIPNERSSVCRLMYDCVLPLASSAATGEDLLHLLRNSGWAGISVGAKEF